MRWDKLYYVGGKAKQSGELQGELAANYIKDNKKVDRNNCNLYNYKYGKGGKYNDRRVCGSGTRPGISE